MSVGFFASACITTRDSNTLKSSNDIHVHQTNGDDVLTETQSQSLGISSQEYKKHRDETLLCARDKKEWDIAITDARAHLRSNPKSLPALQVLSVALAMKQNYSLSAYYGRLIEKYYPGEVDTANIQGLALLSQPGATYRDYRRAIDKFEESFDRNPKQIASGLEFRPPPYGDG